MNNRSISDFVANSMNAALNSDEYKQLFGTQIKTASDENDAKKKNSDKEEEEKEEEKEEEEKEDKEKDSKESKDSAKANDMYVEEASPVYAVAIDSLLTASAALDALDMGRGATLSLKLAELVLAAKKKDSEDKKEEKDSKKKTFPFAKKDDKKESKESKKSKESKESKDDKKGKKSSK